MVHPGEQSSFLGNGKTVGEVIGELIQTHQGLKPHLLDANGKLRSFVRVYVGEDDIHQLNGEETTVGPDTIISIIPAIAGGIHL